VYTAYTGRVSDTNGSQRYGQPLGQQSGEMWWPARVGSSLLTLRLGCLRILGDELRRSRIQVNPADCLRPAVPGDSAGDSQTA
jgi:hypothetical protein